MRAIMRLVQHLRDLHVTIRCYEPKLPLIVTSLRLQAK